MKTNKEIKPFKMRCNLKQSKIAMSILRKNGHDTRWTPRQDSEDLCIVLYEIGSFSCLYAFGIFDSVGDDGCNELTYSEFMKLYGEEKEEVFTREDMKEFAFECLIHGATTKDDVEDIFTNFLSERTNE